MGSAFSPGKSRRRLDSGGASDPDGLTGPEDAIQRRDSGVAMYRTSTELCMADAQINRDAAKGQSSGTPMGSSTVDCEHPLALDEV